MSRCTFTICTLPVTKEFLQPLNAIWFQLLPAITGRQSINDLERELLSLPAQLGSLTQTQRPWYSHLDREY